jgi:hypothetical protein
MGNAATRACQQIFVSTYLLQLPKKEEFEQFLINQTITVYETN